MTGKLTPTEYSELYQRLAHGSVAHRAWLRDALYAWNEGKSAIPYDPKTAAGEPMLIKCPECGVRHIDKGRFATHPHHTHSCQGCGWTWRHAIINTVGVQFLPGFKDDAEIIVPLMTYTEIEELTKEIKRYISMMRTS